MKRYVLEVVIKEGNDEYWESLNNSGKSGCDDLVDMVQTTLDQVLEAQVKLIEYSNR